MSKKKSRQKKRKAGAPGSPRVLADHRQYKKTLRAPLNELPVHPTDWARDLLPEMLWVAAMLDRHDHRAINKTLDILDEFVGEDDYLDGTLSSLETVPIERRTDALMALSAADVKVPLSEFGRAMALYEKCPGAWLFEASDGESQGSAYLAKLVEANVVPRGDGATWLRTVPLTRALRKGKLFLQKDSETAELLPRFPWGLSLDDRRKAGSLIRASFSSLVGLNDYRSKTSGVNASVAEWPKRFWATNLAVSPCDLPVAADADNGFDESSEDVDREPSIDDIRADLCAAASGLERQLRKSQMEAMSGVDLYEPVADEVRLGLAARQVRLLRSILRNPYLWTSTDAPHHLRAMIDCVIVTKWLLTKDSPDHYKRFVTFGTGKLKLLKAHVERDIANSDGEPTDQQREYLEALDREVNEETWEPLMDVDLGGSFAGLSLRKMAEEADLLDRYNFGYQPFSSEAHGEWSSIRQFDLVRCANPLHRFHRVASFESPPTRVRPDAVNLAIDMCEEAVSAVFSSYGVDLGGAFEPLWSADGSVALAARSGNEQPDSVSQARV